MNNCRRPTPWLAATIAVLAGIVAWAVEAPADDVQPAAYSQAQPAASENDPQRLILYRELMRRRGGEPAALAQLVQISRELAPADAASLYGELAEAHRQAGNLDLAAETKRALVEQYAAEPAARDALLWLVRVYSSSEVTHGRRRIAKQSNPAFVQARLAPARERGAATGDPGTSPLPSSAAAADEANADASLLKYAVHLAASAAASQVSWHDDPALTFQRSVALRRLGEERSAKAVLSPLAHGRADNAWNICARCESWQLEDREGPPPKRAISCRRADAPPQLDGVLDDACWLTGDDAAPASEARARAAPERDHVDARWAYDDAYMYLAIRRHKQAGVAYPRDQRSRTHDADVDRFDRVRLLIDVDRDYATWFELVVDSRGCSVDRCWDDATWNPTWFIAAGEDAGDASATQWFAEAAIPLAELTSKPPRSGDAWAASVARLLPTTASPPGAGAEIAAPGPADFDLLLFK